MQAVLEGEASALAAWREHDRWLDVLQRESQWFGRSAEDGGRSLQFRLWRAVAAGVARASGEGAEWLGICHPMLSAGIAARELEAAARHASKARMIAVQVHGDKSPQAVAVMLDLASLRASLGIWEQALLEEALAFASEASLQRRALAELGTLHLLCGRPSKAFASWQKAVALPGPARTALTPSCSADDPLSRAVQAVREALRVDDASAQRLGGAALIEPLRVVAAELERQDRCERAQLVRAEIESRAGL